ncbi:mechanosensitive ion channel family protein [Arcticibacterium luteifluviistationis]|uniref:Mechanosensitive ion channel protein MscS n=1 Tax=Arcticibacterium luteifluviistationis TaxID=1784714 RepID=A0A2Z4GH35_9BACT|nr:mechanosensitive ion channel family protein [Arcticibacterium luteifluviistationis]AWW00388.1 mechanosensitive ion channel protein MscS [Arcticibacterium luteifluviistationis]
MNEITEIQEQLISFYETFISVLPRIGLAVILTLLVGFFLRFIRQKISLIASKRAEDPLIVDFFDEVGKTLNIILLILFFLYVVGLEGLAGSILAAAGISTFVIGFAFKDIGENFLAGIVMAFKRPFRVGDIIEVSGVQGTIQEMNIRDTQIKTFDGKDVFIPNGQILKNPFYNYTIDGFLRNQFNIGIDYGSDIAKARNIIQQTMEQIPGIIKEEKPPINMIAELGASSITITIQYWLDTFDNNYSGLEVKSQAIARVYEALLANNVNMPGDVIELKNYDTGISISNKAS